MAAERILLLEDDERLRPEMQHILEEAGYRVEPAASGAEALARARATTFELLVADIYLPDLTGIETFQQLRTLQPELAGIAVTGFSNWRLSMDAMRAGFTGFLVKPIVPEQLISSVAAALEQEKLRRENARLQALVPLYELSRTFIGTTELGEVLQQIVTTVRQETRAEVVSLMLLAEDGRELSIAAASGLSNEIVESQKSALGSGIAGWVAAHGQPLMISEGAQLDAQLRQAMGKPEVLSALSLPLTARGEIIGVLNLARLRGGEPFLRGDLELASVLAGQAAIAIDKARLIEDLRWLSETSQHLASALDLVEAATIIVGATARVARAQRAALWMVEDVSEQLSLFKADDFSPEELRRLTPPALGMLMPPEHFIAREGVGILWLPITRADKKFGVLELHLPSVQRPRPDRLGVLRTMAHTAAAVIESHRLRAREVTAFREMDSALRSDLNLRQVLERVLTQMVEACGAQSGTLFMRSESGERLEPWVTLGKAAPLAFASRIIAENQSLLLPTYNEPQLENIHSVIGAPLTIGSRVEGAVVLTHSDPAAFAMRHLNLLSVLSSSTALIVRNARLYERSEEAAIGEERTRIAREIHDGIAQDLSFLVLKAEVMRKLVERGQYEQLGKELQELSVALRNDAREVRRTIFALRPLDLEALGFLPALEKFIREFGTANDIKAEFKCTGDTARLTPKLQTALFRLTQESLNNTRKHARASKVWVNLKLDEKWALLRVRDNGRGFEPAAALSAARARGSVGMIQMRERAERAGGAFDLKTALGKGTRIMVRLPIK